VFDLSFSVCFCITLVVFWITWPFWILFSWHWCFFLSAGRDQIQCVYSTYFSSAMACVNNLVHLLDVSMTPTIMSPPPPSSLRPPFCELFPLCLCRGVSYRPNLTRLQNKLLIQNLWAIDQSWHMGLDSADFPSRFHLTRSHNSHKLTYGAECYSRSEKQTISGYVNKD
jgi:hypothetical protein